MNLDGRHPGTRELLGYFAWQHLPTRLQAVSAPFSVLAHEMVASLPDSAELTAGLRKLLEAKDCMVRAALRTDGETDPGGVITFADKGVSYRIEVDAGFDPQALGDAIREALEKRKQKGT